MPGYADTATLLLLDGQDQAGGASRPWPAPVASPRASHRRAEIDQATGMLTEQLSTASGMRSRGCAPMLMHVIYGWPMSPATSWPAA